MRLLAVLLAVPTIAFAQDDYTLLGLGVRSLPEYDGSAYGRWSKRVWENLQAATEAKLIQRVGRGIRLTPEGELLAQRATEILGRVDAASVELAAHVGLRAGRVRLAGFQTVLSTLVPKAAAELSRSYPGIELHLVDAHPVEGLTMLRSGHVDIALIFRDTDTRLEEEGVRLTHLLDDPLYLVSDQPHQRLEDHRYSAWVGGCDRC